MRYDRTVLFFCALLMSTGCGDNRVADDPANASRQAVDYYDECVSGCLADRGLPEEECASACEDNERGDCAAEAEAGYADCIDRGESEEDCSEQAGASYEACTGDRETSTMSDPCAAEAERAYEACIDAGGEDEDCGEESRAVYEECLNATSCR